MFVELKKNLLRNGNEILFWNLNLFKKFEK